MTSDVIHIARLNLGEGICALQAPSGTSLVRLLVQLGPRMLGEVVLRPSSDGMVPAESVAASIAAHLGPDLATAGVMAWLANPDTSGYRSFRNAPARAVRQGLDELLRSPRQSEAELKSLPSITVAVCTRDRPADLERCLDSLTRLEYPDFDVAVVDNAPATDATRRLVAERFPQVRYIHEPRAGLDWARNRAIVEARGEVLAYTDDDTLADPGWLMAFGRLFAASPGLAAVTGSVLPSELGAAAQRMFETYGGFLRGWRREWHRATRLQPANRAWHHGAGQYGTGANMAFRRSVLTELGGFDPALDVGTASDGGGDLEMYFRVLQEGYTLAYSPDVLVRHTHRRGMKELERQIKQWGTGFAAYMTRSRAMYPEERDGFRAVTKWWWTSYFARRVVRSVLGRSGVPLRLPLLEASGIRGGAAAYRRAQQQARDIAAAHPPIPFPSAGPVESDPAGDRQSHIVAVRSIDVTRALEPLTDLDRIAGVEVVVTELGVPVARCRVTPEGGVVGVPQLLERMSEALTRTMSEPGREYVMRDVTTWLGEQVRGARKPPSVTVMLATADRPNDLRRALDSLVAQKYHGAMDIIVVDNRPASGLTAAVVREYPQVRLVNEPRGGASYGRNAGIAASTGDIVVMTDDDVVAPDDWVTRLVKPFGRPEVAAVTGNVLPLEQDTEARRLFELYGGLGKGFVRQEYSTPHFRRRFKPVRAWHMGATANCAIRASVLADPRVGLFDEALGAGTPTGGSEDAYMYYRLLRAGWTVVYEPDAWLWHSHRQAMPDLERQIGAYSTGHVAYHLRILLAHRDLRALRRLLVDLPLHDLASVWKYLRGRNHFPLSFTLAEIRGHMAGPWALWKSARRVRQLGRSAPLVREAVTTGPVEPDGLSGMNEDVEFGTEVESSEPETQGQPR
ncbi:MAG TPA: glycosyltransferase [Gemmatimonadales bacterium]|nr:glycosyltransferase [Gemmatimonadales bacterium]